MTRYYNLSGYFRGKFGRPLRKIPLDAGSGCPNRTDGLLGGGCLYCNGHGSGTGLFRQGLGLAEQWDRLRQGRGTASDALPAMAYLQSFSNTYGPLERLQGLLDQIVALPGLAGLSIATRPDCLDRDKLRLIAGLSLSEIWLELGLQSSHEATLRRINRGHDFKTFRTALVQAHELGLKVCVHVIAGLPGEGPADFLTTISRLNELPAAGIKFHNLYVARGTGLARLWQENSYQPLELEDYLFNWLIPALRLLRPDMVVHRLAADPAAGELLTPAWSADKNAFLRAAEQAFGLLDLRQGQACWL